MQLKKAIHIKCDSCYTSSYISEVRNDKMGYYAECPECGDPKTVRVKEENIINLKEE